MTCISVGNPHCVTLVDDVDSLKLEDIGPAFENHPNFPERVNTEFVQVVDATHLKMRVWERGSGETWACGTGTCATVAALTELGICPAGQDIHVQLRGGELVIRVLPGRQLLMTGSRRDRVREARRKFKILALSVKRQCHLSQRGDLAQRKSFSAGVEQKSSPPFGELDERTRDD